MKKVFLAFMVATVFTACDDSSKTESTTTDSTNLNTGTGITTDTSTTGTMTDTGRMNTTDIHQEQVLILRVDNRGSSPYRLCKRDIICKFKN